MTHVTPQPTLTSGFDLVHLNRRFDRAYPKEILDWCGMNIPTDLVQASNFDLDHLVITDLLYRQIKTANRIPVIFIDTLHQFRETLALIEQAKRCYDLDLHIHKMQGIASRQTFAAKYGDELWKTDLEKFRRLTKLKPLERALDKLGAVAWITGRQRDRDSNGAQMPIFEWDERGRLKINPLANWSRTESWAYVYEHDLIYNPLHDRGYSDIDDEPLTFKAGEREAETTRHRADNENREIFIPAYC
ncbi:MAG: phosphoadenosine phosphosulfate reductase family protein [Cyanobacteriota bacterium]|nr:phosphoadenosine phosphosulfate reductase family protein [Cyanobacteriota bacterium]